MPRDTERGEAGLRMVIAMALIAAVAWTVPMVIFGREAADNAAVLTGAEDGREASGAAEAGAVPLDPIGRANDVYAQAILNNAIRVAQVYFAENGTFDGLTPQVAADYDPTVIFTVGPAAPASVSMRGLSSTTVVLVTATEEGTYLCASATSEVVSFGRSDAATPAQCTGGWG